MSTPSMRSSTSDIGHATTNSNIMKNFMIQIVFAPMYNPCREHSACGVISPKITMLSVDTNKPMIPFVTLAIKIDIMEFTAVFPSSSVHSNRFPFFLTGMICFAYSRSSASPPSAMISSPTGSSDISPSVRPLNRAESRMRQHPRIRLGVLGRNGSAGISQPDAVKQAVAHVASAAAPHAATQTSSADISRERVRVRPRATRKGEGRDARDCEGKRVAEGRAGIGKTLRGGGAARG